MSAQPSARDGDRAKRSVGASAVGITKVGSVPEALKSQVFAFVDGGNRGAAFASRRLAEIVAEVVET